MAWHFSSDKPVYLQIAERIRREVLAGIYPAGSQIPTVRQLALEAAVNPNTVQHALTELEEEGIIIARGTIGRYVTEDRQVLESCRKRLAEGLVQSFMESMAQLSVSEEQIIAMIKEARNEHSGM